MTFKFFDLNFYFQWLCMAKVCILMNISKDKAVWNTIDNGNFTKGPFHYICSATSIKIINILITKITAVYFVHHFFPSWSAHFVCHHYQFSRPKHKSRCLYNICDSKLNPTWKYKRIPRKKHIIITQVRPRTPRTKFQNTHICLYAGPQWNSTSCQRSICTSINH